MVAFSLPEAVSRPLRSFAQSPLLMAIALHAAVLLIPLALLGRSGDPLAENQVTLTELPPVTESGGAVDASLAPPDGAMPPAPPDGGFGAPADGGFGAPVDGGFAAPADGGFAAPADGGFAAPAGDGFVAPADDGFVAPADDGFVAPAGDSGFQPAADDGFVPPPADPQPPAAAPPGRPAAGANSNRPTPPAEAPADSTPEEAPAAVAPDRPADPMEAPPATSPPADTGTPTDTAARPTDNPVPEPGSDSSAAAPGPRVPTDAEIRLATLAGAFSGAQRVTFAHPELYDNQRSYQSSDRPEAIRAFYEQRLRQQGFRVNPVETAANRTVLEVTNGTVTQYLYLLANAQTSGSNIVWSPDPLRGNLDNLQAEPAAVSNFFNALPIPQPGQALFAAGAVADDSPEDDRDPKASPVWQPLTVDQLANPSPFYQGSTPRQVPRQLSTPAAPVDCTANPAQCVTLQPEFAQGVRRAVVRSGLNPAGVLQELTPALAGYQVEPLSAYGGGNLYAIRKDNQTAYLSLVPTQDNDSTAVILWNRSPLPAQN